MNGTLYSELARLEEPGTAFFRIAPYLKLYSAYAHDYELAAGALQELRCKDAKFEAFICWTERLPEVSLKLEALLIVPIQRVPRYRLLLTELLSLTPQGAPMLDELEAALQKIEAVASHINEQIRDRENVQRVINIQKALAGGRPKIVTPGRRLVREGCLRKISTDGDAFHERYFILFSDMLLYCKVSTSN